MIGIDDQRRRGLLQLFLHLILFYFSYTISIYLLILLFGKGHAALPYVEVFIRFVIWTLPVLVVLKNPLHQLKLDKHIARGLLVGGSIGLALCAIRSLYLFKVNGAVHLNWALPAAVWWQVILLSGFLEEVLFRGYLLQRIEKLSSFWAANFTTALLFSLTHILYWSVSGTFELLSLSSLPPIGSLIWLSLLFGFIFKKSGSLWAPILLHSINNFMASSIH